MQEYQIHPEEGFVCYVLEKSGNSRVALKPLEGYALRNVWIVPNNPDRPVLYVAGELVQENVLSRAIIREYPRFPHMDALGNRLELSVGGSTEWMDTAAAFYWDTLLPCTVEGSADNYPDGCVLSTLQQSVYGGTYPDVDHEFQCKGRIALGGNAELETVRRMMELQFRLMREDPIGWWRNPCSLPPNGVREYYIRRNSMDGRANAEMFMISGNVEVVETAWLYVARSRNFEWLRENISSLENAMWIVESHIDSRGLLWTDVFYEDQVMKDGAECMSAALAAHSFQLLSELETQLGRGEPAGKYLRLRDILASALVRDIPNGFWDPEAHRFIDWIDRSGTPHDHIHLLANELPVLFGFADSEQARCVDALIQRDLDEFQRFPTFLSSRIAEYTDGEIGDGGPYDLCAAGRYWCWDAAYWHAAGDGGILSRQLSMLSAQARLDHYRMGERYDMNYVYYVSDINWHGAAHYYEYPNVFLWVLLYELLGLRASLTADLYLAPVITDDFSATIDALGVHCEQRTGAFTVSNIARRTLSIETDRERFSLAPGESRTLRFDRERA